MKTTEQAKDQRFLILGCVVSFGITVLSLIGVVLLLEARSNELDHTQALAYPIEQISLNEDLPSLQEELEYVVVGDPPEIAEYTDLGEFRITFYDSSEESCGKWAQYNQVAYNGNTPMAQYTIAVDPAVIPLGSIVEVAGREYYAEDTGNFSGNIVDIYVNNLDEMRELQKTIGDYARVRIVDYSINDRLMEEY